MTYLFLTELIHWHFENTRMFLPNELGERNGIEKACKSAKIV